MWNIEVWIALILLWLLTLSIIVGFVHDVKTRRWEKYFYEGKSEYLTLRKVKPNEFEEKK